MNKYGFSKREISVTRLMMEGKSNKQIGTILKISVSTVEFHLTRIYAKLGVSSRSEAMIKLAYLGKPLVFDEAELDKMAGESSGDSLVENGGLRTDNTHESSNVEHFNLKMMIPNGKFFGKHSMAIALSSIIILVVLAGIVGIFFTSSKFENIYTRESEHPDISSGGQTIDRSKASGKNVFGQFGAMSVAPWSSQPGFVIYQNILLPNVDRLYLKLLYSKKSPSSVPIQIYLDNNEIPSATFFPSDQGDWNRFVWTDPIFLGKVDEGIHSIKFMTDGQQYGVADLDKFVLLKSLH
jgi:DNA-binding CsgD family transcriptional regulator